MRIILFDIDGTLLLSGGAGLQALQKTFDDRYRVADASAGVEFHGRTDPLILEAIAEKHLGRPFKDGEADEMKAAYLEHLPGFLETAPYQVLDGVPALLDHLEAREDILLGLATGNWEIGAWAKLRRGDLDRYFSFGGFGSDAPNRDELTKIAVQRGLDRGGSQQDIVVIGDTIHDVNSARAAGADCLGVATGNASEETLADAGARWTVDSLAHPRVMEILAAPPV